MGGIRMEQTLRLINISGCSPGVSPIGDRQVTSEDVPLPRETRGNPYRDSATYVAGEFARVTVAKEGKLPNRHNGVSFTCAV